MKYIDKWILVQYVYIFSSSMWLPPISLNQMCTNIRWENCSPCVTWLQCKQANKLQAKTEHNMPLVLYCTVLHCTVLHCTTVSVLCTVLHCTTVLVLCTVLYCTALLYCTIVLYWYCVLYCTVLRVLTPCWEWNFRTFSELFLDSKCNFSGQFFTELL